LGSFRGTDLEPTKGYIQPFLGQKKTKKGLTLMVKVEFQININNVFSQNFQIVEIARIKYTNTIKC